MNLKDYIASGVLEAYLLGELSEAQASEVKAMADKYPEIRSELKSIEETLELMAENTAIAPPAHLKQGLLQKIQKDPHGGLKEHSPARSGATNTFKYLMAASIALAVMSSGTAYIFWSKWQSAENRINDLLAQNQVLTENFNAASHQLERTTGDIGILTDKDYRKVVMNSVTTSESSAVVYWNPEENSVYLSVSFLPVPAEDKQYQLWALVDGQPMDAGVFDMPESSQALLLMKSMGEADAFAITLEPRGGSEAPTLEDLQVIGEV